MSAFFIEVKVITDPHFAEILIAELGELGFDTFEETPEGMNAYAEESAFDEEHMRELFDRYSGLTSIAYEINKVEKQNWNEEWEKNYKPVEVTEDCVIRATFHQLEKKYPYEIIITPKMSFGTGHHATTSSMIRNMKEIDMKGKRVLDAGCGTGVLAIMASKLGAAELLACEIEDWSVENTDENAALNNVTMKAFHGTTAEMKLPLASLDIILANINRNVLLEEIPLYATLLKTDGKLVLSGFYADDIPVIEEKSNQNGLALKITKEQDRWVSLVFDKTI